MLYIVQLCIQGDNFCDFMFGFTASESPFEKESALNGMNVLHLDFRMYSFSLRKHAYSNILKFYHQKMKNFI